MAIVHTMLELLGEGAAKEKASLLNTYGCSARNDPSTIRGKIIEDIMIR